MIVCPWVPLCLGKMPYHKSIQTMQVTTNSPAISPKCRGGSGRALTARHCVWTAPVLLRSFVGFWHTLSVREHRRMLWKSSWGGTAEEFPIPVGNVHAPIGLQEPKAVLSSMKPVSSDVDTRISSGFWVSSSSFRESTGLSWSSESLSDLMSAKNS